MGVCAGVEPEQNLDAVVEVDGGVNLETAPKLVAAGADMLVAGSALYGAADARAFIQTVKAMG